MRIVLSCMLCTFFSLHAFAQVNYEAGYFVDLDNRRVECLIRNYEWKNNPQEFEYKLADGDKPQKANLSSVREFGIVGRLRYVTADVKIDRTGDVPADLSTDKAPVWLNERLFLRVLVESRTSLLYYASGNLRRFFYQTGDTIKQLVYKKYLSETNDVIENTTFRQQLWAEVRCGNTTEREMKQMEYRKNDMVKYFNAYSQCAELEVIDYTKTASKNIFHMRLTPGVNFSNLDVRYAGNTRYLNFDVAYKNQTDFRMGVELEWVLAFNRNKWSIVLEPSYQSFHSTNEAETLEATYNSFEIPIGPRYSMFLNNKSKIFVNALFVYSIPGSSSGIQTQVFDFETSTTGGFALGAGLGVGKFSAEVRYHKNGDILNDLLYWKASYNRWSCILGYRLF